MEQVIALKIIYIDTPTLGDRSYLIHDGLIALVIDPQRDIDRIQKILVSENLQLGAVAETHIHNDYLTGGWQLAREYQVPYIINELEAVSFERMAVANQEEITVGSFAIRALLTPGHTFNHTSYQLIDAGQQTIGIFTGGSLLHGATGRPDLLGWDSARELAGLQYESARVITNSIEDEVDLYPTHGFGSFCSASPALSDASTVGEQRRVNEVFLLDKQSYIKSTLAALDLFPSYFKYMAPINTFGAKDIDLTPLEIMSAGEITQAIISGAWVVDLRSRTEWAKEHIAGSISLGLDGSLASYLGWLYPYDRDLYLYAEKVSEIAEDQRELARIGIDCPAGAFLGPLPIHRERKSIKVASFAEIPVARTHSRLIILDVRQLHERSKSFIAGSIYIPFYEVQSRVEELPVSDEIWVHCASGYRAASVLGFIESTGRTPVLINDDYEAAASVKELAILTEETRDPSEYRA